MTTQAIKNRFEKNNYKLVIDFTGVWVITSPFGFKKSFQSLTAAYKHYFQ
jgi:hypothetical protein